jgi:SET domain-containing protein
VLRIRQGRIEIYAMRAIAQGEEITCNYGETHHEGRLACRCGAPNCVGKL